jgi:uncharacterized membrane protein (DUF106 family)
MVDFISLLQQYPRISIVLIGLLVSLAITIVNYYLLDKERLREIKVRQKQLQEEMKKHQKDGNTQKVIELQKQLFSDMGETMRHSFKPMLITLIPIFIVFAFLRSTYDSTTIASTWLWYYIAATFAGSLLFRKIFNLP